MVRERDSGSKCKTHVRDFLDVAIPEFSDIAAPVVAELRRDRRGDEQKFTWRIIGDRIHRQVVGPDGGPVTLDALEAMIREGRPEFQDYPLAQIRDSFLLLKDDPISLHSIVANGAYRVTNQNALAETRAWAERASAGLASVEGILYLCAPGPAWGLFVAEHRSMIDYEAEPLAVVPGFDPVLGSGILIDPRLSPNEVAAGALARLGRPFAGIPASRDTIDILDSTAPFVPVTLANLRNCLASFAYHFEPKKAASAFSSHGLRCLATLRCLDEDAMSGVMSEDAAARDFLALTEDMAKRPVGLEQEAFLNEMMTAQLHVHASALALSNEDSFAIAEAFGPRP